MIEVEETEQTTAQTEKSNETNDSAYLGSVPLLPGEDPAKCELLFSAVAQTVQPADVFEAMWLRDIVYHQWNVNRFRKLLVDIVNVKYDGTDAVFPWNKTRDYDFAAIVAQNIAVLGRVEGVAAGLEQRRNNTIRESAASSSAPTTVSAVRPCRTAL